MVRRVTVKATTLGPSEWHDDEGNVFAYIDVVYDNKKDIFYVRDGAEPVRRAADTHAINRQLTQNEIDDILIRANTPACQTKLSNPKDSIGVLKADMSVVPTPVLYGLSLAMLEGALKYGKFNYREVGVRASIYIAALKRHVDSWEEGEDYDPDLEAIGVKVSHLDKAIACLVILRDAMIRGKLEDDRRPASPKGWLQGFNEEAKKMIEHYKAKGKEVIHYTEQKYPSGFKQ